MEEKKYLTGGAAVNQVVLGGWRAGEMFVISSDMLRHNGSSDPRLANHVLHDLQADAFKQCSSGVLSTKDLSAGQATPTPNQIRKERARRRFETKNQGWRAGQGRIRGRNGY